MSENKPKPMTGEQEVVEYIRKLKAGDKLAQQAGGEPLPGPLKAALAPSKDITALRWTVRPFYDIDFEFLTALDNPFRNFANGDTAEFEKTPRGPRVWELLHLMTNPIDYAEEKLSDLAGTKQFRAEARAQFGKCRLPELIQVYSAVVSQMTVYTSTITGHDAAGEETSEAAAGPFDSPPTPSTATGG